MGFVILGYNDKTMHQLFDTTYLLTTYGYPGIFLIAFLESGIFFALPGDSLLFTSGLLASTFGLHIYVLIPLIFCASFLGGVVGYEIGAKIEKFHNYKFFKKTIKQEYISKAHVFFEKHGKMAVIFSRFVPIIRTFTPIAAGVAKMNYFAYLKYSLIGALLWSTAMTLLGYFLGRSFPIIKDYLSLMVVIVVFVSILPGVFEIIRARKSSLK